VLDSELVPREEPLQGEVLDPHVRMIADARSRCRGRSNAEGARYRVRMQTPDRPDAPVVSRFGAVEIVALLLLGFGPFLLSVVGTAAGLATVWLSRRWTTGDRKGALAIVAAVTLTLPVLAWIWQGVQPPDPSGPYSVGPAELALVLFPFGGMLAAIWLAFALAWRPAPER
jgi:hypothetical protein